LGIIKLGDNPDTSHSNQKSQLNPRKANRELKHPFFYGQPAKISRRKSLEELGRFEERQKRGMRELMELGG
jgi:hypothetical protein